MNKAEIKMLSGKSEYGEIENIETLHLNLADGNRDVTVGYYKDSIVQVSDDDDLVWTELPDEIANAYLVYWEEQYPNTIF